MVRIDKNTKDKVRGVSGITSVYGYLKNHSIEVGEAKLHLDLAVLDENAFDILIGRDILFRAL